MYYLSSASSVDWIALAGYVASASPLVGAGMIGKARVLEYLRARNALKRELFRIRAAKKRGDWVDKLIDVPSAYFSGLVTCQVLAVSLGQTAERRYVYKLVLDSLFPATVRDFVLGSITAVNVPQLTGIARVAALFTCGIDKDI